MGLLNLKNSSCNKAIAAGVLGALFAGCISMAVWPPIGPVMELNNEEALSQLNTGDTGFVALCTAIVLLMTPGLAFFYGGLIHHKNVVATIMQCCVCLGLIPFLWFFIGFSLCYGDDVGGGILGNPATYGLWKNVGAAPNPNFAPTIPLALYANFQLVFAVITPPLIVGGIADRVNFNALLVFVSIWHLIVYCPVAHMVWHPSGLLRTNGVLDFAGGTVVHMSTGWAAVAAAWFLGPSVRRSKPLLGEIDEPANVTLVVLGTAILWMGWFGFNAGSALAANALAIHAFQTTNAAAATAMIAWLLMDQVRGLKWRATAACVGALSGLVGITPSAGYVTLGGACVIGMATAVTCNIGQLLMDRYGRLYVDDTLDVFALHGVGGMAGCILASLFSTTQINPSGGDGAFYGDPSRLGKAVLAVVVLAVFFVVGTLLCLYATNFLVELRCTGEEESLGLDLSQHGERAISISASFGNLKDINDVPAGNTA